MINSLLNDLLNDSSNKVKSWLEEIDTGRENPPVDFNWHGLAFGSASNARNYKEKDEKLSLEWAEISVKIYMKLAKTSDPAASHGFEMSAMWLQAFLINHFGNISGHSILDSDIIFKWFFAKAELSLKATLEEMKTWKEMSHEEKIKTVKENPSKIIALTFIKNRLTVIDFLNKSGKVAVNNELKEWLEARKDFV